MKLFGKQLNEMDYDFIESLIRDQIEENQFLEYKPSGFMALVGNKTENDVIKDKKKFTHKLCGLANAGGGFLILGIRENNHKPVSPPEGTNIQFINIADSYIHNYLHPKIDYEIKEIEDQQNSGKKIYILEVKKAPHPIMVYKKDEIAQYYIRWNESTRMASPLEVEMLFARTEEHRKIEREVKWLYTLLKRYIWAFEQSDSTIKDRTISHILRQLLELRDLCAKYGIVNSNPALAQIQFTVLEGKYLMEKSRGILKWYPNHENLSDNSELGEEFLKDIKKYWKTNFYIVFED